MAGRTSGTITLSPGTAFNQHRGAIFFDVKAPSNLRGRLFSNQEYGTQAG